MSVTCRRQDHARFEALGFQLEFDDDKKSPVIELIDNEANYAHCDKMPTDIPYYGSYGAGSCYGPGNVVCDGQDYEEIPASIDGYVLAWNYRFGLPKLKSIRRIRHYLKLERRVQKMFNALRVEKPKAHLFSPTTNCCVKCGVSADDDLVENQPCTH
jgi:hypothetical protein